MSVSEKVDSVAGCVFESLSGLSQELKKSRTTRNVGSQIEKMVNNGDISPEDITNYIYSLRDVSAPSSENFSSSKREKKRAGSTKKHTVSEVLTAVKNKQSWANYFDIYPNVPLFAPYMMAMKGILFSPVVVILYILKKLTGIEFGYLYSALGVGVLYQIYNSIFNKNFFRVVERKWGIIQILHGHIFKFVEGGAGNVTIDRAMILEREHYGTDEKTSLYKFLDSFRNNPGFMRVGTGGDKNNISHFVDEKK